MIVLRLIGVVLDVLLLPLRLLARARAVPSGAFLTIVIDGSLASLVRRPRLWEVRKRHATSLHAVADLVDAVSSDRRVRGVLVTMKSLSTGMAGAASLRTLLERVRAVGKEVVVHLPIGGATKEVFVASVATRVILGPASALAPVGFLSSARYLARALEKAGITVEVYARGEYKSAAETFVRDTMSGPQREQLTRVVDGFHSALVDAVAAGRSLTSEEASLAIDRSPFHGHAALTANLADDLAYEDEVPALLGLPRGRRFARGLLDSARYLGMKRRPLVRSLSVPPVIAVIPIHGTIAHTAGSFGSFSTDDRVAKMVRLARADRRVHGVILDIDSPGGSALASDRMHHEIEQLAKEKPVVAFMANVAASGGYYVAAAAHRIVCGALTITGSIGVVAVRAAATPLLERLGVSTVELRRGARAGLLSASATLSDDEKRAVDAELEATYRRFVDVVAAGRKRAPAEIEPLARGRVYLGADALAVGLVDVLGGFDVAVDEVRKRLPEGVRRRARPLLLRLPRRGLPPLALPHKRERARARESVFLDLLAPARERAICELALRGERVLLLWPGADVLDRWAP